ncbi:MAG: OsmC family protein [Candidatus Omnitrophota bacterium]|nr:OsmC family protein [Candidatus Omnitrophota bacterium]
MYRVEITSSGTSEFQVKSKDYEFTVSTGGKGVTPPDTLLASLGSCIGVYIRKYCEGAKINLSDFSVRVEAEFTKEPPFRFEVINARIGLRGARLDERRKNALLDFIRNCPVHNTLACRPQINLQLSD